MVVESQIDYNFQINSLEKFEHSPPPCSSEGLQSFDDGSGHTLVMFLFMIFLSPYLKLTILTEPSAPRWTSDTRSNGHFDGDIFLTDQYQLTNF